MLLQVCQERADIPPEGFDRFRCHCHYVLGARVRGLIAFSNWGIFEPTPWLRENMPQLKRTVFLNNFSAAGGNTAMLLEDRFEWNMHVSLCQVNWIGMIYPGLDTTMRWDRIVPHHQ
jgi:hypothetical protein